MFHLLGVAVLSSVAVGSFVDVDSVTLTFFVCILFLFDEVLPRLPYSMNSG